MKVLMVLTSHAKLGDTGRTTGFWLEELAAPYYEFKDAMPDARGVSHANSAAYSPCRTNYLDQFNGRGQRHDRRQW